jgi:DNA polymerase III epsilon subunit family exonuclease
VFAFICWVQLALDALDRLVEMLEERGSLRAVEAAGALFATSSISEGLACSLLAELTAGDSRVVCAGATVSLSTGRPDPLLEEAEFVVFDLETTGLSAERSRICELGAVRVRALELVDSFQSLVDPGVPLPDPVARLTGLREEQLRGAPRVSSVVRRFLAFAGDDLLVAHNARFDQRFLERQLVFMHGRRLSEPPLCTAALARRLLEGRRRRVGLASLAQFFGVPTTPCHRALPDAEATAEVLVHLIGLAQELGARRLSELRALAAPRKRRVYGKRALANGAPTRPGVYLFRDRHGQVLYVGRARDLRARLRSYFRSERQRPSVEAALHALDRIEWRVLGSELEAALEELRLIRELQPPANSRSRRKERGVYLRRRGDDFVVSKTPTPLGPIGSRRQASLAARALASSTEAELDDLIGDGPLPRLRTRLSHLSDCLRSPRGAGGRARAPAPPRAPAAARGLSNRPGGRAWLAKGVLRRRREGLRRPLTSTGRGGAARDRRWARRLPRRARRRRAADARAGGRPVAPRRLRSPSPARAGGDAARPRPDQAAPRRPAALPGGLTAARR